MIIAFAGCDGVGKTTLLYETEKMLRSQGYSVKAFKPLAQSTPFCQSLLTIKQGYSGTTGDLNTRLRLLIAFETYRISLKLKEEQNKYDYILLDRWTLCQRVYAAIWQNIEPLAEHILNQCLDPDITFIIDADEEDVDRRLSQRTERKPIENMFALKRVLRSYRNHAKLTRNKFVLIDNREGKMESAVQEILNKLNEFVPA